MPSERFNKKDSNLEKIYFSIIQWGIYLALFTPFIFLKEYFFPFVVPKTIFFRIIVDIIFIAYILLVLSNRKYLPKFNFFTITVAVFLAILVLTSFTGVNFERSFWSVFERMTGLLTFFHLFAFFIILISVFKERKYWERILTVSILVGTLICFYTWTSGEATSRGGGTIGNTSFLATYLLFNIFFAIILFFTKKGWWKILFGTLLLILILGLFISEEPCRGAIGAFFGGLFVLGFGYLSFYLFLSGKKTLKRLPFLLLILLVFGGFGALQLDFFKEKLTNIWESGSLQSRMVVWKMSWEGWQEKLWLGWGLENFNAPFAKYFDPELPLTRDIWYDRAHNIILDTGVTSGILGLIGYLAIFGVAIFQLLRTCLKVTEKKNLFFPLGMIALLLVYIAQNIWVFDMISSYMMFFLSLAFVNFLISPKKESFQPVASDKKNPFYSLAGILLIIITVFTVYFGNIQPARASKLTVQGLYFPLEHSVPVFQKALEISSVSQFETPEQFSRRIIELASQPDQNKELLADGFNLAEESLKKSIAQNPQDFRLHLFLGRYYNNLFHFTGDKEKNDLAEQTLNKAAELSPKNQQVYWSLAQTRLFQGRFEEAIVFLQKAVDLEPRFSESHWYLVSAYKIIGEYELALAEAEEAEKLGYNWKENLSRLNQVIEIYRALGDNVALVPLYEKAVTLAPQDHQLWGYLADVYAALGEREKAKQAAQKVLGLKPELAPQVEQFLKDLGY